MNVIITVRMKKYLADALAMMAESSHRSKSGTIRWLISQAIDDLDVPITEIPSIIADDENEEGIASNG